ncbi:hypothetical protein [Streptomyces sp. NPDC058989]|uniref:hypothetical protein n=1 Tax=Streptomyces sp. NPDC058989 TaxID=3346686 RepID=UPI0036D00860
MTRQLRITVQHADDEIEFLQREVDGLQEDLLLLDVERVDHPDAGPAPEGARGGAAELLNVLLVALPPVLPLLEGVVGVVKEWLGRCGESRSVLLEIDGNRLELTGVRSEEQRRLVEAWLARCAQVPRAAGS